MDDDARPAITHRSRRRIRISDVILLLVFIVICFFLARTLWNQLSLRHEVSAAKVITSRVVADIATQNAKDTHQVGDAAFQAHHSVGSLSDLFAQAKPYTKGSPTVDRQTVTNDKQGQTVYIIYKYQVKPPYYLRVTVAKPKGTSAWHLTGLSGNPDESQLIVN
jgi:hypothetical protein